MSGLSDQKLFTEKFRLEALHLASCGNWVLSLRPGQLTLGAMVLSIGTGATSLTELTSDDGRDMTVGFAQAERLLQDTYGAVRLNLLCLMMQDPIVHFHILPRYDCRVQRHGQDWSDFDWPGPPTVRPLQTPEPVLQAILADLRAALLDPDPTHI